MGRASSESAQKRWEKIVRQQRGSGLSVAAFCRRERVPQCSFFAWKRRLAAEQTREAPAFVEVTPQAAPDVTVPARQSSPARTAEPLELLLGSDRRLVIRRGFDAQALREVVRVLEGLS